MTKNCGKDTSNRIASLLSCTALALTAGATGLGFGAAAHAQLGAFEVEIREPAPDLVVPNEQEAVEVVGRAEIQGGVRNLDLFLVMDTSKSLRKTDPDNHRSAGAVGLVKSLLWTDAKIGVVDFDKNGRLVSPLSSDRTAVMAALRALDQNGKTDLAGGIRAALEGFAAARPGSTRVMLLFTDGRSEEEDARTAMAAARDQGVLVSTLLLGSDEKGAAILQEIAEGTGGSFVAVTDPASLPDAFLSLRTGVQRVALSVNESPPALARLTAEGFAAKVPVELGENRIVARASSIDGRQTEASTTVTVRTPGCAELELRAERDGEPALSISNRAVEIVVDGSGSMWGKMGGRTKIEIAKEILDGALQWLPPDLNLSLRAYGHRSDRREQDCEDTELLVATGVGNRAEIQSAIRALQPKGQTPLGYSLAQVSGDFGDFVGERAVVLVTDGLESCDGDAEAAARALQAAGPVPVHVIGFGLGSRSSDANQGTEDLSSLQAIADASGGRFITAGSASELRRALGTTVGTPYSVWQGDVRVAQATLGADAPIRLPAGEYRVQLDSVPAHELQVTLTSEQKATVVLQRDAATVSHSEARAAIPYTTCDPTMATEKSAAGD